MKRLTAIFVALLGALLLSLTVAGAPPMKPTADFYVNDFAGMLSEQTKADIIAQGKAVQEATTAQVVVTTVPSLEGTALEDYSLDLSRRWAVGQKGKDNGVILLVSRDDRKARIEVGYGLEGALPDGKTGRIMDTFLIPKFKAGDYDGGVTMTYRAILAEVYKEYNVAMPQVVADADVATRPVSAEIPSWVVVVGFIIFMIFMNFLRRRYPLLFRNWDGRRGGGGGGGFGGGGGTGGGGGFGGGGSSRGW